jgi:hypothetical protein
MEIEQNPALVAGALAGVAGLVVFLIIHHIWIQPIWFILPFGLVIAALGGLAVGRSYAELLPHFPPLPWSVLAVIALISVILLPSVLLAELRAPLFDISVPGGSLAVSVGKAAAIFIFELLGSATLMGALAGWLVARTPQAAAATALAGFVFALGPGHNIPFLGGTPATLKGVALLLAIVSVSAVVLVVVHALLNTPGTREILYKG